MTESTSEAQTNTVDLNGVELTVTPFSEMSFGEQFASVLFTSQLMLASKNEDHQQIDDAMYKLFDLAVDEPIRRETFEHMSARDIADVAEAITDD